MKKTGQLLKEKREAANLSLSEVALATKINPKVLTAMENGDEANLPSKTFLKGFLRAYAVFLKINPEEVLRSYQEETGQPVVEVKRELEVEKPAASASATKGPRRPMKDGDNAGLRTAAVIVIVVLIGVIILVKETFEKYQREKQVEASAVKVSPLAQPGIVPEGTKAGESTATPAPAPTANADTAPTNPATIPAPDMTAQPAPAPTAPEKPAAEPKALPPPPPPSPVVSATPTPPTPATLPPPPPPPAPAPAPEKKAETPKEELKKDDSKVEDASAKKVGKFEVILEALDKVDITFQIKGETKKISLGPNQVHTIHADQPLTLEVSDGGAVSVILNGREKGVPGELGKPKTVKLP